MRHLDSWEKFLDPARLRGSLLAASMYIAAYETCKGTIIDHLQSYFADYWDEDGAHPGPEYDSEVRSLAKNQLQASLLWFRNIGAIDDSDIESFSKARKLRNRVAHNLPQFLSDPAHEIDQSTFDGLLTVTHKIGVWWVVNIEIATNPDYDGQDVNEEEIQTGTIMIIRLMMDIALGNEPEEGYYFKAIATLRNS